MHIAQPDNLSFFYIRYPDKYLLDTKNSAGYPAKFVAITVIVHMIFNLNRFYFVFDKKNAAFKVWTRKR
jgi:hypothetical protein